MGLDNSLKILFFCHFQEQKILAIKKKLKKKSVGDNKPKIVN